MCVRACLCLFVCVSLFSITLPSRRSQYSVTLQKPWKARDPWPVEAADAHYLIGQCNMELHQYPQALDAFTDAIRLNGNMAEVSSLHSLSLLFYGGLL